MNKLSVLLLLFAVIASIANAAFCKHTDEDGKSYDFSPLAGKDQTFTHDGMKFVYRFCDVVSESSCQQTGGAFCFYPGSAVYNIGRWKKDNEPKITGKVAGGLVLAFTNGDQGPSGRVMNLNVHLTCGAETTPTAESLNADFDIYMTHPVGCPKSDDDGLSGGAIFLIVLISVLPVYIIAGCAYNHKVKGTSLGLPSCPQRDFWFALPGLVKDGIIFTIAKLRGCCNKGSSPSETSDDYGTMA